MRGQCLPPWVVRRIKLENHIKCSAWGPACNKYLVTTVFQEIEKYNLKKYKCVHSYLNVQKKSYDKHTMNYTIYDL